MQAKAMAYELVTRYYRGKNEERGTGEYVARVEKGIVVCNFIPHADLEDEAIEIANARVRSLGKAPVPVVFTREMFLGYRGLVTSDVAATGYRCIVDNAYMERNLAAKVVIVSSDARVLPDGALRGCSAMQIVIAMPNLCQIGDNVMTNCLRLKTVIVARSPLYEIGDNFLRGCESVVDINIDAPVISSLGDYCFNDLKSLETLRAGKMSTLLRIGDSFLRGCDKLKRVDGSFPDLRINDNWEPPTSLRIYPTQLSRRD